jgi:glycosyltransferase involved in cell wall biosynthesis
MGYFLQTRRGKQEGASYRIVDSRGPWFLGASPLHVGFAGCYLAIASLKLLAARFGSAPCIAHVNITGRGSTVRKVILLYVARLIGMRYILHVHDYDYAAEYCRHGALVKSLIATTFRCATKILVLGVRDQGALTRLLELPQDQVTVLHNAVPDPLPDFPKVRYSEGPFHFLFLGRLSARKGVPELLRALASPELRSRQWRATVAGDGPIDEFRRLTNDFGISERVNFPGWLDQSRVGALCSDADVLVLPSHAEGLAMAVLEGLSHGLAVITTPVGAHSEVIEPEVSGILVPPGDVEALTGALVRLIEDKNLCQRLRAGARSRFLEKFDVRAYAERLGQLHMRLLSDPRNVRGIGMEQRR